MPAHSHLSPDPRLAEASTVLLEKIEREVDKIAGRLREELSIDRDLVSVALFDLVATSMREDVARERLVRLEMTLGRGQVSPARTALGQLLGMTRQGVERRFALTGTRRMGGLTAVELREKLARVVTTTAPPGQELAATRTPRPRRR